MKSNVMFSFTHVIFQSSPVKFAYTRIEPVGVVGLIVPWNFPRKLHVGPLHPVRRTN